MDKEAPRVEQPEEQKQQEDALLPTEDNAEDILGSMLQKTNIVPLEEFKTTGNEESETQAANAIFSEVHHTLEILSASEDAGGQNYIAITRLKEEYDKLNQMLKESRKNEGMLVKKCKDMAAEVNANARKIQTAVKLIQILRIALMRSRYGPTSPNANSFMTQQSMIKSGQQSYIPPSLQISQQLFNTNQQTYQDQLPKSNFQTELSLIQVLDLTVSKSLMVGRQARNLPRQIHRHSVQSHGTWQALLECLHSLIYRYLAATQTCREDQLWQLHIRPVHKRKKHRVVKHLENQLKDPSYTLLGRLAIFHRLSALTMLPCHRQLPTLLHLLQVTVTLL
jgi:hypothetical protein